MSYVGTNRIAQIRKKKKWSQHKLAEELDVHWVTISKIERGRMQLTQEWLHKISKALSVPPAELLPEDEFSYELQLLGGVQNGCVVNQDIPIKHAKLKNESDEELHSMWVKFIDDLAWPHFRKGDMIRFVYWAQFAHEEIIHRICMIWDERRQSHIIGFITRGMDIGTFDFRPLNGTVIHNIENQGIHVGIETRLAVRTPAEVAGSRYG